MKSFLFFTLFGILFLVPKQENNYLFKIERSIDADAIYYKVNTTSNGNLNQKNPIDVFWLRHSKDDEKEPLTWVQENYSYGVEIIAITPNVARFQFAAYDKRDLILKRDKSGKFKVFLKQKNDFSVLKQVNIQIDGGTFWLPEIKKVDIHTLNSQTGKKQLETIVP